MTDKNSMSIHDFAEQYINDNSIAGQDAVKGQIKKSGKKAYSIAIETPNILVFMADHGLIPLSDIDKYLVDISWVEYPMVIKRLLQYKDDASKTQDKKSAGQTSKETEKLKKEWMTGKMPDGTLRLKSYKGTGKKVVLPTVIGKAKVSAVGEFALSPGKLRRSDERFTVRHSIKEIVVPEGVTEIESSAFADCSRLERVVLPKSLRSIGNDAFHNCKKLESVCFGDDDDASTACLKSIGNAVFWGCEKLKYFDIPQTVISIGSYAFYDCFKLSSIVLPEEVAELGEFAFFGTPFFDFKWPKGVKTVNAKVYSGSGITSFELPEGVEVIGPNAFHYWVELKKINLPTTIQKIEPYAFSNCCSLKEIRIPSGVQEINQETFSGCRSLEKAYIPSSVKNIDDGDNSYPGWSEQNLPFWNCEKLTIYTPSGSYAEQYAIEHEIPVVNYEE